MNTPTRADVCVVACAEAWRGDGEIVARPIGVVPSIAARLARATFAPDLLLSDGDAYLVTGTWPIGRVPEGDIEGWLPYRSVFEMAWGGKGHIMMMPAQVDRYGNANLSAIGDYAKPTRQLVGVCGAPGNTVNNTTSYWVPKHLARSFPSRVDVVCGVGYDSAETAGSAAQKFHEVRRVITNLAVLDFDTSTRSMRLVSVHPGVDVEDVHASTGFPLGVTGEVPETRTPTAAEMALIEQIDPDNLRYSEVP
ncbi:CoA-transferase subunit beta [Rhodococcus artemisiae]|uniref:CoA-transferase n=1 Tax=Rhodococcus artemisiae TaxID=714159 RepID=A0ABU7LBV2_9NOCA|nr:CoA-transferase [Rhodococcus artemisiae]MEE2058999.1 CoA-transferase [Rhodococcus artemisiae]